MKKKVEKIVELKTEVIAGKIWEDEIGENYHALLVGYNTTPFAQRLYKVSGWGKKQVTIRYWISETEKPKYELMEDTLKRLAGSLEANYREHHSDLTGYLWTDEEGKVGGHDLVAEIRSFKNKFLYMEIDYK